MRIRTTALLSIILSVPSYLPAQGSLTIFGTVSDSSGGVIPSATITVTHNQTGTVHQVVSGAQENYLVSHLLIF